MMYAMTTDSAICGHRSRLAAKPTPCQLPRGDSRADGRRDSAGADVRHVWQDHGPADHAPRKDVGFWRCTEGTDRS